MYDLQVHDPMAERYFYVLMAAVALAACLAAVLAMEALYPLQAAVPFIVSTNNIVDDLPRIRPLAEYKGQDSNEALMHFLVRNYVTLREEYNIDTFERNKAGIRSQSAPSVTQAFEHAVDPHNPESPVMLYQRHSKRRITIISARPTGRENEMEVVYEASVEGVGPVKKSRWQANIAFQYEGIALDEKTDKVKPFRFTVTDYRTRMIV